MATLNPLLLPAQFANDKLLSYKYSLFAFLRLVFLRVILQTFKLPSVALVNSKDHLLIPQNSSSNKKTPQALQIVVSVP